MCFTQAICRQRSLSAIRSSLLGALLGIAFSAGAFGQTPGAGTLSLQDALQLARDRSQQLPAQDALATASREMAVAAAQRPDPILRAGVNNLPVNGEDRFSLTRDFMTMRSVGLMQELTRSDKLRARSSRYEKEAEAAEAGRSLALTKLQAGTASAWLDRYFQERMREVLLQQRDEAKLQIEAADTTYRGARAIRRTSSRPARRWRKLRIASSRWIDRSQRPPPRSCAGSERRRRLPSGPCRS